ncbi:hypothetical protein HMI56_006641 [Coelomomyces lativittatus]|nr:hypothetical protein HMI56_006641 [Coelomomyces lativittatus]
MYWKTCYLIFLSESTLASSSAFHLSLWEPSDLLFLKKVDEFVQLLQRPPYL